MASDAQVLTALAEEMREDFQTGGITRFAVAFLATLVRELKVASTKQKMALPRRGVVLESTQRRSALVRVPRDCKRSAGRDGAEAARCRQSVCAPTFAARGYVPAGRCALRVAVSKMTDPMAICIHEAGHCVAAWAVGNPADRVFAHGCWVSFDRSDPKTPRREATISWAGPLAQGRYQSIAPEQRGSHVGHRLVR